MRIATRLKIGCQRPDANLRKATLTPVFHTFAGSLFATPIGPESGPRARRGHILDTAKACAARPRPVVASFRRSCSIQPVHPTPGTGGRRNTPTTEAI